VQLRRFAEELWGADGAEPRRPGGVPDDRPTPSKDGSEYLEITRGCPIDRVASYTKGVTTLTSGPARLTRGGPVGVRGNVRILAAALTRACPAAVGGGKPRDRGRCGQVGGEVRWPLRGCPAEGEQRGEAQCGWQGGARGRGMGDIGGRGNYSSPIE